MEIVGIDFGTTNVRVSTWDSDGGPPPEPQVVGSGGTTTMPAVVALRRQPGGEVSVIVGEEADSEIDDPNETLVIRNIKRYALSDDAYVNWHLEARNAQMESPRWPPTWWDPQKRCVQAWGREFPVWDLIGSILKEALDRADVGEVSEWRAGCPVHASFGYRAELTRVLHQITGTGNVNWVVEEPILFLLLVDRLGSLGDSPLEGSYLVYDLGGGSFDCALVEFREGNYHMNVYGAEGHPLLGGSDIDTTLIEKLGYNGQPDLIRKAKERLNSENPSETLADGTVVTLDDLDSTLTSGRFVEESLNSMRDAYIGAKQLWKRSDGKDDPPIGEVITRDSETSAVRFVWQLTWDDLARDVDGIILFGGPTKSQHFSQHLSRQFGAHKIMNASELLPPLTGLADLELVGISMGACYSYQTSFSPMFINRLPARVTLANLQSGDYVEYEPFENFAPTFNPFCDFVSEELPPQPPLYRCSTYGQTIQLTITLPNGEVKCRTFLDKQINSGLMGYTLKLVIDRFGRVGVEQASEKMAPKRFMIFNNPPWQTEGQLKALQRLFSQQQKYEERQRAQGAFYINKPPWEYPTA